MAEGALVLVVGPSGVGKDTLIDLAREALAQNPKFTFPRRIITRDPDAGHEIIEPVTEAEFTRRLATGEFCLHWAAHGLHYGLPAGIKAEINAGHIVVVNGSRTILTDAMSRFARVQIVLVSAPRELLAERLAQRGRESADDRARRLTRSDALFELALPHFELHNTGTPQQAASRFISFLLSLSET